MHVCMCVCMHRGARVCICEWAFTWKPEIITDYLPWSFSSLFVEALSVEFWAPWFSESSEAVCHCELAFPPKALAYTSAWLLCGGGHHKSSFQASASSTDQHSRLPLPTFLISKYNIGIKFNPGSDHDRGSGMAEKIPDCSWTLALEEKVSC